MVTHTVPTSRHTQSGRYKLALIIILTLALLLVILHSALPNLVKDYLNKNLADMGEYQGHIEDVDLALWRGAYSLNDITIIKKNDKVGAPFFEADTIDLAISWPALLKGAVVAEVDLIKPELHFVDANNDNKQSGAGTDWQDELQQLLPIRIDQLVIENGELHFHNFQSKPPVHLVLTQLNGQFTDISNKNRDSKSNHAHFKLTGLMLNNAEAVAEGNLNPLGNFQDFDIKLRVTKIDLTRINDFAEAYGNFNMESGQGEFVMELHADDGMLQGYAKPLFDNVAILDIKKDSEDGVLSVLWESIVAGLGQIFRNQPEDRIAAQIQINGNLNQNNVSAWQAFISILRNAFVKAYEAEFREE